MLGHSVLQTLALVICDICTFFSNNFVKKLPDICRLSAKNDPAPPLGNFADIVYLKEQSFLHRIRDLCTL